jgi:hypothetical protein
MNPKEQAIKIFNQYSMLLINSHKEEVKLCSIIAVDVILDNDLLTPQLKRHYVNNYPPTPQELEYWQQVKKEIVVYPDDWIRSYKWEIRNRSELLGLGIRSVFKEARNPAIPENTSVLAFHGYPHIHSVQDPVILENWR